MLESILSGLGSISSIVGLIIYFKSKDATWTIKALLIVITLLTASSSMLAYKNYVYSSAEQVKLRADESLQARKDKAIQEAKLLIEALPSYVNLYDPGGNEGIIYSGITFLEKHQSLFPLSYNLIKDGAVYDIEEAKKDRDSSSYNNILKNSAESMLKVISGLAGPKKYS